MNAERWGVLLPLLIALGCGRGGASKLPAPRVAADARASALPWVGADVARASAAGAGQPLVVASGMGASGDSVGGRIDVPPDDCVLVLARGSPSIEDLDVFVYADDGAVLGADDKPTIGGTVLVCPPHPRHVYAFGRLASGHGMLAVSAQLVRRADAQRAAQAVGAKGDPSVAPITDQGWPGLDEALRVHRRALGVTFRDVRRLAAPLDARLGTRVSVATENDGCLDVFVVPSDDVAFVEVTALDGEGRIVARAPSDDRTPSLLLCAPAHTDVTIELRPHAGRGLAAVIVGSNEDPRARKSIGGSAVDLFPTTSLADARAATKNHLVELGYPTAETVVESKSEVGVRTAVPVTVPEGCSRVEVITGSPARGVDAWLWSSSGVLIAHDDGPASAVLFACGGAPDARLDVEMVAHGGPFAVEVRNVRSVPPPLTELPLAAGRLLGRLSASDRLRTPKDAGAVKRLRMGATELVTERVQVAEGSCLDVAFALDAGAQGAELRLIDDGSGSEIASARGTYSAFAETCALDRPNALALRAEMRVGAGTSESLFTTLTHPVSRARR